jgi:hypothetical protein
MTSPEDLFKKNSSGSLAIFAAIRRALSRARYYAERVTGAINKTYWCRLFARAHSK